MQGNGRTSPETTAACIDAETLAAWAEGGLSTTAAAAVETHLADCERCTAMVATFARTIPEPAAAESLWKRWHLRWLIPAATAATVAALWVLVPSQDSPQTESARVATSSASPDNQSEAPQLSNAGRAATLAQPSPPADTKELDRLATASKRPDVAKRAAPQTPPQLADERRADAGAAAERFQATAPSNEPNAAAPARESAPLEAKAVDAQTDRFAPPMPSANAAPAAPTEASRSTAAPPPAAPAPPSVFRSEAGARAVARTRDTATMLEIASPDSMSRWRVVGAGQVERSTNGGARWEPATLPEAATLTHGSSPSRSVCWLAGRTGAIYVTTDGLRFVRVPFPERTDFISIQALDGRRATVVTIDGRTMRTDDQGANWIRVAP